MFGTRIPPLLCRRAATPTWPPLPKGLIRLTGAVSPCSSAAHVSAEDTHFLNAWCALSAGGRRRTPISARTGLVPSPWQPAHGLGRGPFSTWCRRSPGVCREPCRRRQRPGKDATVGTPSEQLWAPPPRPEVTFYPPPRRPQSSWLYPRLQKLAQTAQICQAAQRVKCLQAPSTAGQPGERAPSWSLARFRALGRLAGHGHRLH